MNDPLKLLGLKTAVIVAGFAGGLVSLQELNGLTRWKVASALFTSLAIAGYGTPLIVRSLGVQQDTLRYGIAFLLGLCAMRIVPLIQSSVPFLWNRLVVATVKTGGPQSKDGPT